MAVKSEEQSHRRRAWSVIAIGEDPQYADSHGDADDPGRVYRYDSQVANSRNVAAGDLLFLRNNERLMGIGRVERIDERAVKKFVLRCSTCGITGINTRKTMVPRYRCDRGHVFEMPRRESAKVIEFGAHYASTFIAVRTMFPVSHLKKAALRPSAQLSIEEIDPQRFADLLISVAPACRALLNAFLESRLQAYETLDAYDALENHDDETPYAGSTVDTRPSSTRTIRWRRGRLKFRRALMERYGVACMVTGCRLVDLLEAAHISPYRGEQDNHASNGLLLRADIHTLFDLNLLAIDPDSMTIRLAPEVRRISPYAELEGVRLRIKSRQRPAAAPLADRWAAFASKYNS